MSKKNEKVGDVLMDSLKRKRAIETCPRKYLKDEKRRKTQDYQFDENLMYDDNDNNDGYENANLDHENNHPTSRTRDDDWDSDNEVVVEEIDNDDTTDNPVVENRRSLRLASVAAASEPVPVVPKRKKKQEEVIHAVWGRADMTKAVDEKHRELLQDFNENVVILQKLQRYLVDNPHENRDAYVFLCEDEIIKSREAEWEYLQTCDEFLGHEYIYIPVPEDFLTAHRRKVIKGNAIMIGKDEHGKWPCTDLVAKWIEDAKRIEEDQWVPNDAEDPIQGPLPLQPGQSSVKDFLRDFSGMCAKNNTPYSHMLDYLDVMDRHIPGLRLGIRTTKGGRNRHDLQKYLLKDYRDVRIDVCPNNCILFIGEHSEDIKCPCGEYRFSKCGNNGKCKHGGVNCSPFITPSHHERSSFQEIHYRPLLIKLFWMYKESLTGFNPFAYMDKRYKMAGHMSDIVDSPVFQEHTQDMHEQFEAFLHTYQGAAELKEFSVCLSMFYDGDKLYKRNNDSVWPLVASVLNCDPSYRSKLGLGLFAICIHNLPTGSPAEQSIIDDLLTEELKQLENGILFEFALPDGSQHAVFIQARVIFWSVDTRAYEEVMHVSTTPSLFGCPDCARCSGLSRTITGAPAYVGATLFLPQNHALRHMARQPMPAGYFDGGEVRNAELGKELTALARATPVRGDANLEEAALAEEEDNAMDAVDNAADAAVSFAEQDFSSLRGPNPLYLPNKYSWISTKYPYHLYSEAIDPAVTDTRLREDFSLVGQEEYVENSRLAMMHDIADFIRTGRFLKQSYKVNNVDKIIGAWVVLKAPLFHESPFDIMHCAANIIDYIFAWIIGTRGCELKTRKLCLAQMRLLFLGHRSVKPGWKAGMFWRQLADSIHRCMNYPTAYTGDYQYDLPLHYAGNMNSHQKSTFMVAFSEYFFSFLNLYEPYYHLYCRFAHDLRQVSAPYIPAADKTLKDQVLHVVETASLFSAMLPDCQQPFVIHQFLHIVNSVRDTGPSKNTACYTGERFMGLFSKGVAAGGLKYARSATKQLVGKENAHKFNFKVYEENVAAYTDNTGAHSNCVLKLLGPIKPVSLNEDIKTRLFLDVYEFLSTQTIVGIVLKSPFVRLYFTFEAAFKMWKKVPNFPDTFAKWIHALDKAYNDHNDFSAAVVKHLVSDVNYDTFGAPAAVPYLEEDEINKLSSEVMTDVVERAVVYYDDFDNIIRQLADFGENKKHPLATHMNGIVKGVTLTGRGEKFAEKSFEMADDIGNRQAGREFQFRQAGNTLKDNWSDRFQVNSWCRVSDYYIVTTAIATGDAATNTARNKKKSKSKTKIDVTKLKTYFGQINYMFRMYVPCDEILNGCAFANVLLRKCTYDAHRGHHYVGMNDALTYHADKHFVSLNYVDSTAIALSALDEDNLPVMNPSQVRKNMKFKPKKYNRHFSKKNSDELSRLYLIELHKERLGLLYTETVETDPHSTKVFEKNVLKYYQDCDWTDVI